MIYKPDTTEDMTAVWENDEANGDWYHVMTSSNGSIFRVTGHLCGEFAGDRWIPRTKASDVEFWCFLWPAPEWKVE